MDPNQDQGNQGFISKSINYLNRPNSIVRWGKRVMHPAKTLNALGGALGLGQAGGAGAAGATAAAGGTQATAGAGGLLTGLGPLMFIGFGVVLVITLFMIFSGGAPVPFSDNEIPAPSASGIATDTPGPYTAPDCTSINTRLRNDFGIIVSEAGEVLDCEDRQTLYRIYSIPTQSSTYKQYLKPSTPFTIQFLSDPNRPNGARGYTPSGSLIRLWNFSRFLKTYPGYFKNISFLVIHETGHLIKNRNYLKFYTNYPHSALVSADLTCYENNYLKTYSRAGSDRKSESMAESSALYTYGSKTGNSATISNFSVECPATYGWTMQNLYGNTPIAP